MRFRATTVQGSGRGKDLSVPTVNVDLTDVPKELDEGIYACLLHVADKTYPGAMHYGPRPVFNDTPSCEVHVIDTDLSNVPTSVEVEPKQKIRDVRQFNSPEDLTAQMHADIAEIRAILGISHDSAS